MHFLSQLRFFSIKEAWTQCIRLQPVFNQCESFKSWRDSKIRIFMLLLTKTNSSSKVYLNRRTQLCSTPKQRLDKSLCTRVGCWWRSRTNQKECSKTNLDGWNCLLWRIISRPTISLHKNSNSWKPLQVVKNAKNNQKTTKNS